MPVGTAAGYPQHSGSFVPEIWSGVLNQKFYEATVLEAIANTNWEGEVKNVGDKVNIRQTPDTTISDYVKGQQISYENLEADVIELLVDKAKYFAFRLDDIDKYQSDIDLLDDWGEDAGEQMKIAIDTQVLGSVYSDAATANAGNAAGAISGDIDLGSSGTPFNLTRTNIYDYLVNVGVVLDEQNVPEDDRYAVLPAWAVGLIKKSELRDASLTGDGQSMARNGRIGMIDRLTVFYSNLLNSTSGKFDIICGQRSAVTFASQITEVNYFDQLETTFGCALRGLNVYGFKTVKAEALVHGVVQKGA